jgi:hypothetical protein
MDNRKRYLILGIVIACTTITITAFIWKYDKNQKELQYPKENILSEQKQAVQISNNASDSIIQSPNQAAPINVSDSFQYSQDSGFYGTLTLTGYIDMKQRICKQGDMCHKTVTYASFVITSASNKNIYTFLTENKGNSFAGDNSIGLGCYEKENQRIYSLNSGDDENTENIITNSDLQKLLQSNKNNTVTMQLVKPSLTVGGGASECYSHFRSFKIIP